MSVGRLGIYDRDGFARVEAFFIYAAFAPDGDQTFIKIGMSSDPLRRIYGVHCGSQVPVELALWANCGSKRQVRSAERRIHSQLEEFKSRGEWFRMDMKSPEHKQRFHSVCRAAFARATGRKLEWRKSTIQEIRDVIGVARYVNRKVKKMVA